MPNRARLVALVALAGLAAACGNPLDPQTPRLASPTIPTFATSVETSFVGGKLGLVVTPWPFDATVAFLCVDKPGAEFTAAHPVPGAVAHCAPMGVSASDDRLTASLGAEALSGFRLTRPAYLAVAGSRGPVSTATILTVVLPVASAVPS